MIWLFLGLGLALGVPALGMFAVLYLAVLWKRKWEEGDDGY